MLGFGLAHGAGGALGTLVFVSFLVSLGFLWVAGISATLFLVPAFRRRYAGWRRIVLMFGSVLAFLWLAVELQAEWPTLVLLLGAAAIVLLAVLLTFIVVSGVLGWDQRQGRA